MNKNEMIQKLKSSNPLRSISAWRNFSLQHIQNLYNDAIDCGFIKPSKKPTYKPIKRNRDKNGFILTYSVDFGYMEMEFNTLKEAKIMAIVID